MIGGALATASVPGVSTTPIKTRSAIDDLRGCGREACQDACQFVRDCRVGRVSYCFDSCSARTGSCKHNRATSMSDRYSRPCIVCRRYRDKARWRDRDPPDCLGCSRKRLDYRCRMVRRCSWSVRRHNNLPAVSQAACAFGLRGSLHVACAPTAIEKRLRRSMAMMIDMVHERFGSLCRIWRKGSSRCIEI